MKTNQTMKIICFCLALAFAVSVGFGQTETNDTSEPPTPPVKEQQVEPTPSKEEIKSQEPQVVWNGEVMIEEQNKLIRSNQNNLIKSLDSIVTEIQKSNKQLEESVKSMSQQQASLAAQLAEVSKNLDQTTKMVQASTEHSASILNKSLNGIAAKVKQLSSQIVANQEKVKTLQEEHSSLLSKLTDSTGLANDGVNQNKTLLGEIQSENSQLQEKISSLKNEIGGLEAKAKESHEKVEGALGSISSKLVLSLVLKTIVILAALGLSFYVWKNKKMITGGFDRWKQRSTDGQHDIMISDRVQDYLKTSNKTLGVLNDNVLELREALSVTAKHIINRGEESKKALHQSIDEFEQHLEAVKGLADERKKEVERYRQGFDIVAKKTLVLDIIETIDIFEIYIRELKDSGSPEPKALECLEVLQEKLVALLENDAIEQFSPEPDTNIDCDSIRGKVKIVGAKEAAEANQVGKIASIKAPCYYKYITDVESAIIRPALVIVYREKAKEEPVDTGNNEEDK